MRRYIERATTILPRLSGEEKNKLILGMANELRDLEAALNAMAEALVFCDEDDVPIFHNRAAERMLRYINLRDKPVWRCVQDDDIASFIRKVLEGRRKPSSRELSVDFIGGVRIFAVSIRFFISSRGFSSTLIHVVDATEKKQNEISLHRAESLASLTTLAAGVAHEIKNPLGALSIHTQLLKKALGAPVLDRDKLSRHSDIIDEEILRLNRIIIDFLFATSPIEVQLLESDLGELVRSVVELIEPEVAQRGISLQLAIAENLPPVPLDAKRFRQALMNLVKNSLEALGQGRGPKPRLSIDVVAQDREVNIVIADNGPGIDEENLAKIFEPYFTTKEKGTGLGLTITYRIIKEHRGDIKVKNLKGGGASFTISLPLPAGSPRQLSENEVFWSAD